MVSLTHWGRDNMAAISQTTFSNVILLNENVWISIKISLKFVPKDLINNIPALVQIMAWRRPGAKPSSEATMVRLPTHICVTRPQWVKMTQIVFSNLWPIHTGKYYGIQSHCPASRTTLVATRFRVAVICPIIQVPHCIRVFFYFVWFVFINHIFQFYYELCTYCNILDIYLS